MPRACTCGWASACGDVEDRAARDAGAVAQRDPVVDGARGDHRLEDRRQLGAALDAGGVGGEARVVGERGERRADGATERAPLGVVADGDVHEAVPGPIGLVGRDRRVLIAATRRHAAGREVDAGVIGEQRDLPVEHRDVDVLAATGARARVQRDEDAGERVEAGDHVGDRGADLVRRAVGGAGQRRQAAHALDGEIVAGAAHPVGVAGVAEAGDAAVDERAG